MTTNSILKIPDLDFKPEYEDSLELTTLKNLTLATNLDINIRASET